ncbi:MAG: DUF4012 domain-containing protein [Actinomycetota bacterium]
MSERSATRPRRRVRVAIAMVVLAGAAAVTAQATLHAAEARRALERARRILGGAGAEPLSSSSPQDRLVLIDRAATLTEKAISRLSGWPLAPLGRLPILGRDLRVAYTIATEGRAVLDATRDAAAAADPLVSGRIDGPRLDAASHAFLRLAHTLQEASRKVRDSASLVLSGSGRRAFLTDVRAARRSADASGRALGLAARFYGSAGSVRYFLAFQNPAELRGTGGLIGQYGLLESSPDGPRLVSVSPIGALQARTTGAVALSGDAADRYRRFGVDRDWTAVNVPPDFPTAAAVIVDLYSHATGARMDGVIAVDPLAAAKVLEASGPIAVSGVHLAADNVADVTMIRAYQSFASDNAARSRFLAAAAAETFAALVRGLRTSPARTLTALTEAARGRHVQAYSTDPADQGAFASLGITGSAAAPRDGDYLMPVGVNVAGNKLDAFLRRDIRYEVRLLPDGDALATASLTLRNEAPPRLPEYVQGPHDARFRAGQNRQFQTLYLAGGYAFTRATLNDRPTLAEAQVDLGALALSQEVDIDRGKAVTLAYELQRAGAARIESDLMFYSLLVRPQATAHPDQLEILVGAPAGWRFLRVPPEFRVDGRGAAREGFPLLAEDRLEFVLARSNT